MKLIRRFLLIAIAGVLAMGCGPKQLTNEYAKKLIEERLKTDSVRGRVSVNITRVVDLLDKPLPVDYIGNRSNLQGLTEREITLLALIDRGAVDVTRQGEGFVYRLKDRFPRDGCCNVDGGAVDVDAVQSVTMKSEVLGIADFTWKAKLNAVGDAVFGSTIEGEGKAVFEKQGDGSWRVTELERRDPQPE